MNMVYIVIKNGEIDAVFLNRESAENHKTNLQEKWNIVQILEKEIYNL